MELMFAADVKWLNDNGFIAYKTPFLPLCITDFVDMQFVATAKNRNSALCPSAAGPPSGMPPMLAMVVFNRLGSLGMVQVRASYDAENARWRAWCDDLVDSTDWRRVKLAATGGHAQDAVRALFDKIEAYKPGGIE